MNKNKTLAEQIKKVRKTPYQLIAEKYNTCTVYVSRESTDVFCLSGLKIQGLNLD